MSLQRFDAMLFHSSTCLPPNHLPDPMETHLWYLKPGEVKSESLIKHYFSILSPCEKENVLKIQCEELRKNALLSRILVRTSIARCMYASSSPIDPRTLKFRRNVYGKPELDWGFSDDRRLHFNLSHSPSLVACAVKTYSQVGVDVEDKRRRIKHGVLSLAGRYFTKHETEFLAAISDPQLQRSEFIKMWTLKESYVKAIGKGFSGAPFGTFTISYKSTDGESLLTTENRKDKAFEIAVDSSEMSAGWHFMLLELANSHFAAICTEKYCGLDGKQKALAKLKVWRTIPYVEDEYVSGTDAVRVICGFT
ncbi:hypothetical protein M569_14237 [Genlisea aurea]|uniref:holo-[acyl-carrier-protein] synthase n=1 Tax=Genlisea aurea TaxID=192259 RepID=S8C838_9LAMI|nr:hypothetical protein M569_14237 [Genlisea aurea]